MRAGKFSRNILKQDIKGNYSSITLQKERVTSQEQHKNRKEDITIHNITSSERNVSHIT